jgi:hypothetical protein
MATFEISILYIIKKHIENKTGSIDSCRWWCCICEEIHACFMTKSKKMSLLLLFFKSQKTGYYKRKFTGRII